MDCITRPHRYEPRFELGQLVSTPGTLETCPNVLMQKCLIRRLTGDWGCVCAEDKEANDQALTGGGRILSAYAIDPGESAATIYTLTQTAKMNGLDPEAYLRDVIERIAEHPNKRIGELLPWNIVL